MNGFCRVNTDLKRTCFVIGACPLPECYKEKICQCKEKICRLLKTRKLRRIAESRPVRVCGGGGGEGGGGFREVNLAGDACKWHRITKASVCIIHQQIHQQIINIYYTKNVFIEHS